MEVTMELSSWRSDFDIFRCSSIVREEKIHENG